MPQKRHPALQPLSRDHHFSLLLCWKIRTGIQNGIEAGRILRYCKAYYDSCLAAHFQQEENTLFPLLGHSNAMAREAIRQHRQIEEYLANPGLDVKGLSKLEKLLEKHIRLEERQLFPAIQELIGEAALSSLHFAEDQAREPEWEDEFWK